MKYKNNHNKLREILLVVFVSVLIGLITGGATILTSFERTTIEKNIEKGNEELSELLNVYNEILDNYYKDVDKKELIQGAIEGMLSTLDDPNSSFLDADTTSSFNDRMTGQYKGLGIEILDTKDKEILIVNIFENSPAHKSKLKVGDIIVSVDGKSTENLKAFELANLIKFKESDDIKLGIKRDDKLIEFNLVKEEIVLNSVVKEIFESNGKKQGYLKITIFAANTYTQFKNELLELEKENIDELVIDVRNNSGGYLSSVSNLLDIFIEKGKPLYQMETKEVKEIIYAKSNDKRSYPIKLIINQYSASASEILAISLKESYGAKIFGVKSYGKGTVQEIFSLDSGAMTKITIKEWFSPLGNKIDAVGVNPDVKVELDKNFYLEGSYASDNQLQEALKN